MAWRLWSLRRAQRGTDDTCNTDGAFSAGRQAPLRAVSHGSILGRLLLPPSSRPTAQAIHTLHSGSRGSHVQAKTGALKIWRQRRLTAVPVLCLWLNSGEDEWEQLHRCS
jgi:hypothetical protein